MFTPQTDFRLASRCQSDPSLLRLRWIMIKMGWTEYLPTCACNGCCGSCLLTAAAWAASWLAVRPHFGALFEGTDQVLIVLVAGRGRRRR